MTANRPASAKSVRVRRLEFGFFIRKIVNGRVVSERQFPRGSSPRPSTGDRSREETKVAGGTAASPTVRSAASAAPPPLPDPPPPTDSAAGDGGSTSEETTYEVGFFLHSTSVTPPEYPDEPITK